VVVSAGDASVAVAVERVLGVRTVVVEPIPAAAHADAVVAGAAFDHAGRLQLVLAPAALVERAEDEPSVTSTTRAPAPVLVIDDSLTTRMLEQSILVSAGFEVELAASAEEGLQKARQRRFALFLVDVEMPGMDGFEFVATTRADPVLRETPAILVTSRNAPEDKRRGKQVGARAYIVKGEFDQQALLETIRRLIGEQT
jgi:two-component system chemotaxis sensor kinase CheA